jgi:hypothetical protein
MERAELGGHGNDKVILVDLLGVRVLTVVEGNLDEVEALPLHLDVLACRDKAIALGEIDDTAALGELAFGRVLQEDRWGDKEFGDELLGGGSPNACDPGSGVRRRTLGRSSVGGASRLLDVGCLRCS